MTTSSRLRATSAAVVVGAGVTLAPLAFAAPATAAPLGCLPGTAAYPPGVCTYRITPFGYPISLTTYGDPAEFVVVFGNPADFTVGFGATFYYYFGPGPVSPNSTSVKPNSTSVNAQGQTVATFSKASVPAGATSLTIRQAPAPTATAQGQSPTAAAPGQAPNAATPAAATADSAALPVVAAAPIDVPANPQAPVQLASVPNGDAVAQDAVNGTNTTTANVANAGLTTSTVSDSSDTNGYLLPVALIGGVVVAAGAVTVIRRRVNS